MPKIFSTGDALARWPAGRQSMSIHIRQCQHCGTPYDWRRSLSSSLKMTYCGALCETADLGFTIETLLNEYQIVRPAWRQLLAA